MKSDLVAFFQQRLPWVDASQVSVGAIVPVIEIGEEIIVTDIAEYRLLVELGQGGFGTVYGAEIKKIEPGNEAYFQKSRLVCRDHGCHQGARRQRRC